MVSPLSIDIRRGRVYYHGTLSDKVNVLIGDSASGKSVLLDIAQAPNSKSNITVSRIDINLYAAGVYHNLDCGIDLLLIDEFDLYPLGNVLRTKTDLDLVAVYPTVLILGRDNYNGVPINYKAIYKIYLTDNGYDHEFVRAYPDFDTFDASASKYICEDSKSSYFYYSYYLEDVVSADGNSNISKCCKYRYVIADGAALGPHIREILSKKILGIYAPISFEYDVCKAFFPDSDAVRNPYNVWDTTKYASLEQLFTALLTYMLNRVYNVSYTKNSVPRCVMVKQLHRDLPTSCLSTLGKYCEQNKLSTDVKSWEKLPVGFNRTFNTLRIKAITQLRSIVPDCDKTLSDAELACKYANDYADIISQLYELFKMGS